MNIGNVLIVLSIGLACFSLGICSTFFTSNESTYDTVRMDQSMDEFVALKEIYHVYIKQVVPDSIQELTRNASAMMLVLPKEDHYRHRQDSLSVAKWKQNNCESCPIIEDMITRRETYVKKNAVKEGMSLKQFSKVSHRLLR